MIKVTDYISNFLSDIGIKDVFLISGGGMMHILDSIASNKNLNIYCNLNEQATSICADAYSQYTNQLSVFAVTTGPGGTNAVTGVAASWMDSVPVLAISGQTKTADIGSIRGLRYFGAQEVNIVEVVKPITKYAVTVMDKQEIKYHLEKAVYLATHGRRGPVWIDVPLDIQGSSIEESNLVGFDPIKEGYKDDTIFEEKDINKFYELLNNSKRPMFLFGGGAVAANKTNEIREFVNNYRIPTLTTWRAKGMFGDDEDLYYGYPGIPTIRYSNYTLQNCDLLIIVGTRLNPALTAYAEDNFAVNAKKVIVDIDFNEIEKLKMNFELKLCMDSSIFVDGMINNMSKCKKIDRENWITYCDNMKNKYPLNKEIQPLDNEGLVDGYLLAEEISRKMSKDDIFVGAASGVSCGISHMAIKLKPSQKFVTSMGLGSMGFTIPAMVASSIAGNKKRVVAIEGDGSLQHNIQELALITSYEIPAKIFIISNTGYAQIYKMQKNNFKSNFAGCSPENGLIFPSLDKVADTYGFEYFKIENNSQIDDVVSKMFSNNNPMICEVMSSINFDEIPKSMTIANSDGTFTSSKLENLYPFISDEEQKENMPIWED